MAKPIHETLRHLMGGTFLDEAGEKLAELVAAVDSTGKAGKITMTIAIKKSTKAAMAVVGEIKLSKPMEAPDATLMFATPEGNLSSQFFANVLLDALDQHIKHGLRCKHYVRYVDDMVLLHESPQWLNAAKADIDAWLPEYLGLRLNPTKTILQPVARGVDFVGQVIRPWHRVTRKRTVNDAMRRVREIGAADLYQTANSYFGLLRQAKSHHQRARLSNVLRYRGHVISGNLTKTYRRKAV